MSFLSSLQLSPEQLLFFIFIIFLASSVLSAFISKWVNKTKKFWDFFTVKVQINVWIFIVLASLILYFCLLYVVEKNSKVPVFGAADSDCSVVQVDDQNTWKRLDDNKSEWNLTEMNKPSEGVYCPRIYEGNYKYRSVWYQQHIPVVFNQIQVRFSVKQPDTSEAASKVIIQFKNVYKGDYDVAEIYLPFDKTRGINFKSYDAESQNLVFQDNAGTLPLSIKPESVVTVTASVTNVLDNTVTYQFHIDFIPDGETDSIGKDVQYLVKLPDSSPELLLMEFGIGVFADSCLQNIEYSISN